MEKRVRKLYKGARKNEVFLQAIKDADNEDKPSAFADNETKVLFATIYYGWLVAEYGIAWESYV